MMICILIIILLITPFLVDFFINGKIFLKRLKIGRWLDRKEWKKKINEVCNRWIKNSPTVKKTDNSRLIILDILKGNYKNSTIQSWQIGSLYLGLIECKSENYNYLFIDKYGNWLNRPTEVDFALLGYAILRNTKDKNLIKPAMDEIYDLILSRKVEEDNGIAYRCGIKNIRFVDTVGFVAPFLALYGQCYSNQSATDLSLSVIKEYYKNGFIKDCKLPVHAYDISSLVPLGIYGWGRGAGWYLLGIMDSYLVTKDKELKSIIIDLADKYLEYQKDDGSFGSILQLKNGSDSSITAICAYYYACCEKLFNKDKYREISEKCIAYLMSVTRRNGEIDFSQGDTKGIGLYSTTYDIMPFTQGMALRAISILNKLGDLNE